MNNQLNPIIIIGAGRSGTNMLRNLLTGIDGIYSWPCDELPFVWRYGNRRKQHDELAIDDLKPEITNYIRNFFYHHHKNFSARFLVEKTCANTLRVPFVYEIFPNAKYIMILRDGRDVVSSARERWKSYINIPYTLKKARYIPHNDILYYLIKFSFNRLKQLFSRNSRMSFWGPVYDGMQNDVAKEKSLLEICSKQWVVSVEKSINAFDRIPQNQKLIIKYENIVSNPTFILEDVLNFLNIKNVDKLKFMSKKIKKGSVGKHKKIFDNSELTYINTIIQPTMLKAGYDI